jgi:tetratricopeptide (TPR) repeat protein
MFSKLREKLKSRLWMYKMYSAICNMSDNFDFEQMEVLVNQIKAMQHKKTFIIGFHRTVFVAAFWLYAIDQIEEALELLKMLPQHMLHCLGTHCELLVLCSIRQGKHADRVALTLVSESLRRLHNYTIGLRVSEYPSRNEFPAKIGYSLMLLHKQGFVQQAKSEFVNFVNSINNRKLLEKEIHMIIGLAVVSYYHGDWQTSLDFFDWVIELSPACHTNKRYPFKIHMYKCLVHECMGKYEEAVQSLIAARGYDINVVVKKQRDLQFHLKLKRTPAFVDLAIVSHIGALQ